MAFLQLRPLFPLLLLLCLSPIPSNADISAVTSDGTQEWAYIDVRPGAHMFWWLYYNDKVIPSSNLPLIMWSARWTCKFLRKLPGEIQDIVQIGDDSAISRICCLLSTPGWIWCWIWKLSRSRPLTVELKPRSSTWLNVGHLLFVDNSVGPGYSYVENSTLLVRNNEEATNDLVTLLEKFFDSHKSLKTTRLCCRWSYGGKFTTELGIVLKEKIDESSLNINFKARPEQYAWSSVLQAFSLVDEAGAKSLLRYTNSAASEMKDGNFVNATLIWSDMEEAVLKLVDSVDFHNLLKHLVSAGHNFQY